MPHDMPREDYASPAMYTFSYLSRIVRYLVISGVSLGLIAYAGFEGSHWYIEHVALAAPSREGGDEYGWQEEHQGWTGGRNGGTDSRLGWKGRHALRGAWLCQELGAGATPGSIGSSAFHGDHNAAKGLIGAGAANVNKVDRGYELADEYLDVAIKQAVKKELVFPSPLSVVRPPGPPRDKMAHIGPPADPTAIDLLLLKAGILERIATNEARSRAQDLYESVLVDLYKSDGERSRAKIVRLATKVGDLSARRGDGVGAREWWNWGLATAGVVSAPEPLLVEAAPEPIKRGWFGSSKPAATTSTVTETRLPVAQQTLQPPVLRATVSLLVSLAAHHATASSLPTAQSLQSLALSLLPSPLQTADTSPAAQIHYTWLRSRQGLLSLHLASVLHAQDRSGSPAASLQLLETAVESCESIIDRPPSNKLPAVRQLLIDTVKTSAEAHYTRAVLVEKAANVADREALEGALEDLERAQGLVAADGEGEGRGVEWQRYFKAAVRVRSKLGLGSE